MSVPMRIYENNPQTEALIKWLEQIVQIPFSEEQRSHLVKIVNNYLSDIRIPKNTSNQELKRHLKNLRHNANQLVEDLDPPSLPRTDALWRASRYMPGDFLWPGVATMRHQCEQLAAAAEQASKNLSPEKPGRPPNAAEKELLRKLHSLLGKPPLPYWKDDTYDDGGEPVPIGGYNENSFFQFCKILLQSLDLLVNGRKAEVKLGQRIRRAVS